MRSSQAPQMTLRPSVPNSTPNPFAGMRPSGTGWKLTIELEDYLQRLPPASDLLRRQFALTPYAPNPRTPGWRLRRGPESYSELEKTARLVGEPLSPAQPGPLGALAGEFKNRWVAERPASSRLIQRCHDAKLRLYGSPRYARRPSWAVRFVTSGGDGTPDGTAELYWASDMLEQARGVYCAALDMWAFALSCYEAGVRIELIPVDDINVFLWSGWYAYQHQLEAVSRLLDRGLLSAGSASWWSRLVVARRHSGAVDDLNELVARAVAADEALVARVPTLSERVYSLGDVVFVRTPEASADCALIDDCAPPGDNSAHPGADSAHPGADCDSGALRAEAKL